jgi:hypothetical protein
MTPPPPPRLPPHRATKEHLAPSYSCSSAHLAYRSCQGTRRSHPTKALRWLGSTHWQLMQPEARPLIPAEPMGIHSVPAWQPGTGAGGGRGGGSGGQQPQTGNEWHPDLMQNSICPPRSVPALSGSPAVSRLPAACACLGGLHAQQQGDALAPGVRLTPGANGGALVDGAWLTAARAG